MSGANQFCFPISKDAETLLWIPGLMAGMVTAIFGQRFCTMLMESFYDGLVKWQPFFTASAGVAATLAGLLFVALSLNRERIAAEENRLLMRHAYRSFGDFLLALFIALLFLVPVYEATSLIISLAFPLAFRGQYLARSLYKTIKMNHGKRTLLKIAREYLFQALSWLVLLLAAIEIYRGKMIATYLIVPVIALLMYNATLNAWQLLILEKRIEEKE